MVFWREKKWVWKKKQISIVNQIIGKKIGITNSRLNLDTYNIKQIKRFTIKEYGFEWTEDFDGIIDKNYFNFKFITDSGGAQTRSLRECYLFIKTQLEHLLKYNGDKKFINILDEIHVLDIGRISKVFLIRKNIGKLENLSL